MDCPRCRLALRRVDYEGVEADLCDECWGMWLDTGELEEILAKRSFEFNETEREQILDLMDASSAGPTDPAPCPRCGKTMRRRVYDEAVRIVLDGCPEHGVWLDTGEIKKVQAVAEKSGAVHKLLLRKLGMLS